MFALVLATVLAQAPKHVEFAQPKPGSYELRVNGKPFFVKGAGASEESFAELAKYGANSIRTWGMDDKTGAFLDKAHKNGLMVTLGFWMRKQDGFSYKDPKQLAEQLADLKKWVNKYKNHPTVLMWSIGNEVEIGAEWPEIWPQTEAPAKAAKALDPHHPVIGIYADMWPDKMTALLKYCPSLDAIGINSYDGLPTLDQRMADWKKPYLVTEYQFSIPSKDDSKPWAGSIEPSSDQKAQSTVANYRNQILKFPGRVLGSYFFYWGPSQVGTAAFHTTKLSTGEWLANVRFMSELWGGQVPKNHAPSLALSGLPKALRVRANDPFLINFIASDVDGDRVTVRYELLPNDPSKRFVGDFEKNLGVVSKGGIKSGDSIKLPKEPGLYRILLVSTDGKGAAATESISLLVE